MRAMNAWMVDNLEIISTRQWGGVRTRKRSEAAKGKQEGWRLLNTCSLKTGDERC